MNQIHHSSNSSKSYYVAVPDNEYAFYAYINLIINNKNNSYVAEPERFPKNFGPVKVCHRVIGDADEPYIEVTNLKDYNMIEMFKHQFHLLRTYWQDIEKAIQYPNASKYDRAPYESRRHSGSPHKPKY